MTRRQVRWRGGVAAAVLLAMAGLLDRNGTLLLAAAVPLVYVAVASLSTSPRPEVTVARELTPQPARPGETVAVTLTVRNAGDRTLPDVRVADGVPADLAVVEGTPRGATTLAPGEELAVEYRVVARRGDYEFTTPRLRTRGLGAGAFETFDPPAGGERTLVCRLDADAPPLENYGEGRAGTLTTDRPGQGLAFHSVREHHRDDPASRIDWRHYAKRGDLATVNYQRPVPATVVVVLDARAATHVVAGQGRPTAVELGAYAATRAVTDLLGTGHEVGVAVLGLSGAGPAGLHWLPPGGGDEQRALALELFRTAAEADPEPRGVSRQVSRVLELAPAGTQMALLSPLLDDPPVEAVETWRAADHPVTVLSPDVVPSTTVSGELAAVRRRTRLARCQAAGAAVVDWRRGTPLALVVEHAFAADARLSSTRARGEP